MSLIRFLCGWSFKVGLRSGPLVRLANYGYWRWVKYRVRWGFAWSRAGR
jgi:hypothetical protein